MKKTVSFSRNASNVFFHILTRCNLNCRHCYINPEQHGRKTLPLKTIEKWLTSFATTKKAANIIFLGGEPTLHPDLPVAVKIARQLGFHSVTVDTNGFLFNDILSKVNPDEVDYISFSLDGATRLMNDMIRGKGTYDQCLAGIRQAVSKGFHASLIYTVSQTNISELANIPRLVHDLGVDRLFIQVIGIRGKLANSRQKKIQVHRDEWIHTLPDVATAVAALGITVTYPKVFLNPEEVFECAGLVADNYFIFPNGRVYRCPLCEDFPLHSLFFENNKLVETKKINEYDLFTLNIPEGCVMNKIIQPENLSYREDGSAAYKIACCMLKEEVRPS